MVDGRAGAWWLAVRDSLWFVPTLITAAAAALALGLVEVDARLLASGRPDPSLAFRGGAEGARGVLTAIAGSMVTVTGVVFSLTVVALQLASSQFSPRVLRTFTADRGSQVVLGVFIGTFTYTLLVLRTVRSAADEGGPFVPSIAAGTAIGLALASVAFMIYYIHHMARSMQAAVIIDRVADDTNHLVRHLFPEPVGRPEAAEAEPAVPAGEPAMVTAARPGYLQAIDGDALFALAAKGRLTVQMEPMIGDFVLPGAALAAVWPATAVADGDLADQVREGFVLGPERTLQQDVEFGLRQLADIATKALSPGINDPTTATMCIDRLAEVLVNLGNRRPPERVRSDGEGRVCLVAREASFERAVDLSFDQIRHYGIGDARLVIHLLEALGRVALLVPARRRGVVARQVAAVLQAAREDIRVPVDVTRVEQAGAQALARAGGAPGAALPDVAGGDGSATTAGPATDGTPQPRARD